MTSSCPSSFDLVLFTSEKAYILMWANPRLERFEIVAIILENIDSKKREKGKEGKRERQNNLLLHNKTSGPNIIMFEQLPIV